MKFCLTFVGGQCFVERLFLTHRNRGRWHDGIDISRESDVAHGDRGMPSEPCCRVLGSRGASGGRSITGASARIRAFEESKSPPWQEISTFEANEAIERRERTLIKRNEDIQREMEKDS
jgi:hypothetical protein